MSKYITVKLTEDQALDITEILEQTVRSNELWLKESKNRAFIASGDLDGIRRKLAFRTRMLTKLNKALAES